MHGRLEMLGILIRIALQNLFASKLKTLIVGGIICFGALLVVLGSAMTDTIGQGIKGSVIHSLAGHLQVYSDRSKDELALYGGMTGDVDLTPMEDFSKVKQAIAAVPNVKAVVPMGIGEAFAGSGNALDRALESLRAVVKRQLAGETGEAIDREYQARKNFVRRMVGLFEKELGGAIAQAVEPTAADRQSFEDLKRSASDEFWAEFEKDKLAGLEFLENKVAPQALEGDMLFVRYVGTDPQAYQQAFDRFEIAEGQMIPPGKRGILLGKVYYDQWLKMKTAFRLDRIHDGLAVGRTIAKDEELKRFVKENTQQVRDIVTQLDELGEKEMVGRIQKELGSQETELGKLLVQLFQTDDGNFERRYQFFYEQLAPMLRLYSVQVGETITIKAFTKSGYVKSVNVKVWGICQYRGMEKSQFSGMMSVMDLMSFRDLYGYMSAENLAEIDKLKQAAGARQVDRENAEADLFGGGGEVVAEAKAQGFDENALLDKAARRTDQSEKTYTREELEKGVALNSAIVLEDPSKAEETRAAIEAVIAKEKLGLKVVDWQKASGMVGQFVNMLTLVLFTAVLIIFAVALVIINNSMVMATLQRIKEIGTLRAIGAQRRFVLGMIGVETLAVGLLFGALGSALGSGLVKLIAMRGIPATSDEMYFIFSGPALRPYLSGTNLVIAFAIVLVVSVLSAFYPAVIATRITPLEAMSSEE